MLSLPDKQAGQQEKQEGSSGVDRHRAGQMEGSEQRGRCRHGQRQPGKDGDRADARDLGFVARLEPVRGQHRNRRDDERNGDCNAGLRQQQQPEVVDHAQQAAGSHHAGSYQQRQAVAAAVDQAAGQRRHQDAHHRKHQDQQAGRQFADAVVLRDEGQYRREIVPEHLGHDQRGAEDGQDSPAPPR